MRNAAGHIGPCSLTLGLLEGRNVIKGHDIAFGHRAAQLRTHPHQQCPLACGKANLDFPREHGLGGLGNLSQQFSKLWHTGCKRLAYGICQIGLEQHAGGTVGQFNPLLHIQPDHTSGHARQNGLGKTPALIDLPVRQHQFRTLAIEFLRHAVESTGQAGDLIIPVGFGHMHTQIALTHPASSHAQQAQRAGNLVGQSKTDKCGNSQNQQSDQHKNHNKCKLDFSLVAVEVLVIRHHFFRPVHVLQNGRVNQTGNYQHKRWRLRQLNNRAHRALIWRIQNSHIV